MASPPPTPPNCRLLKTASLGTAATARLMCRVSVECLLVYRYSRRGRLHACMAACLFERLQGCVCVFKKADIEHLEDISFFFFSFFLGHQCQSEFIALRGRARRGGATETSSGLRDHQTAFITGDEGKRRRGRACTYETQSYLSVKHFVRGGMRSLGHFKTLPKPGTNHYTV